MPVSPEQSFDASPPVSFTIIPFGRDRILSDEVTHISDGMKNWVYVAVR